MIVYGVGSAILGLFAGLLWLTFFGHPTKMDRSFGPVLFKFLLLGMVGPFLWCELLTRAVGNPMERAVLRAHNATPVRGPMQYYRVVSYGGNHAGVLIIGQERDESGFTNRTVSTANLERNKDGKWVVMEVRVLVCDRLNKDALVMPPYQ